jgi:diadenosine tetraphosphate (Ap4A) HIT family hydrolase
MNKYSCTVANTTDPKNCPFCQQEIIERQQIHESSLFRLFYSLTPAVEGNLLLIPKRHVTRFENLDRLELLEVHQALQWVPRLFEMIYQAKEYLILQKNGALAGQSVAHIHFHLIPMRSKSINHLSEVMSETHPISDREMQRQVKVLRRGSAAIHRQ